MEKIFFVLFYLFGIIAKTPTIPGYHQITTAFIPQSPEKNWQEPWQDSCEEASLLTVKYYYQKTTPSLPTLLNDYQHIFSYENQNGWTHDVNLKQISQISSILFKLKPIIVINPTIDNIKEYLLQDVPVIVPANGKILYQENKHFKSEGPWYHNLVILGYDDATAQFTVHDVGTQFGAYYKYSYSLLMSSIHDFPPSGNKEDINTGDKKILILLK
jgi:hypothetical protein